MVELLTVFRLFVGRRCHVQARSMRILSAGKLTAATSRAICVPETGSGQCSLEVTGRLRDTHIRVRLGRVRGHADLSESWHPCPVGWMSLGFVACMKTDMST